MRAMKLRELKTTLERHPHTLPRFILPDGDHVPAHFHLTEVGHVARKFIDCGGVIDAGESCLLQLWLGADTEHRLQAGRMAQILDLGARVLPHDDLNVEVEYDCCVVAHYAIERAEVHGEHLDFVLGNTRTQCLARERREKATAESACCDAAVGCC